MSFGDAVSKPYAASLAIERSWLTCINSPACVGFFKGFLRHWEER